MCDSFVPACSSGMFICVFLLSTVRPKFIEQDKMERKSVIIRPVGSSLRLRCRAAGNPLPLVHWMKGGQDSILISDDGSKHNKKKWTLKLRDLQKDDSGNYQCVVSNRHGIINFTYSVEVIGKHASLLFSFHF